MCKQGYKLLKTQHPPLLNDQKTSGLHRVSFLTCERMSAQAIDVTASYVSEDFCVTSRNSRILLAHMRRGASVTERPVYVG